MRDPRMWWVKRGSRASLGRRGALGYGLMGVLRVLLVAAVESLRDDLRGTVGTGVIHRVSLWPPRRAHACLTHVGRVRGALYLSG